MKACAYCQEAPHFHFARNVSTREKTLHWMFAGCPHAEKFKAPGTIISDVERPGMEAAWDAHAEVLFAEYTAARPWTDEKRSAWLAAHPGEQLPATDPAGWTDISRAVFRDKLWPKPPPVIPAELFNRYRDEEPAF